MEFSRTPWVTREHFDALSVAIETVTDSVTQLRLREVATLLVQHTTEQIASRGLAIAMENGEAPLLNTDLAGVRRLLTKGVQHNGVVTELDTVEVSRSLAVAAELLNRAEVALSIEDQHALEWVFSVAAGFDDTSQPDVRRVEAMVRRALGLGPRLVFGPYTPDEIA